MEADRPRLDLQRRGRTLLSARAAHSLSATNVADLVREIAALVVGFHVRAVHALPPRDLVLVLEPTAQGGEPAGARPADPREDGAREDGAREDGAREERERARARARDEPGPEVAHAPRVERVRLSADPDAARLHLQRARLERHAGPVGPFFREIERVLVGARLAAITQVAGDRVVALEFRDGPEGERRTLVLELVGRHSNLALLGPADRVLDVLVPPPAGKQDARLALQKAYTPPPGRAPASVDGDPWATLPDPSDAVPLRTHEKVNSAPLSWRVECALGTQAREARRARELAHLLERVRRKHERARSLVHGLEERLAAAGQADRVRQDGELLKMHLADLKRGLAAIEVVDVFDENTPMRRIVLEPRLGPRENLERMFERAKKLARAQANVVNELAIAREKSSGLEALEAAARAAATDPAIDPAQMEARAVSAGLLEQAQATATRPDRKPEPPTRLPYRVFQGFAGGEIRVGRSAKDNDDLTFHHANGNDLWLHTADAPGSHVVLKLGKHAEPHPEELLDAAHLAVHHSPIAGATRARVHVARRKEVHKPRGAKPGLVALSGGKTLELRMQPERLERLLGGPRGPVAGVPPRPNS